MSTIKFIILTALKMVILTPTLLLFMILLFSTRRFLMKFGRGKVRPRLPRVNSVVLRTRVVVLVSLFARLNNDL